jgi:hypothetical protein
VTQRVLVAAAVAAATALAVLGGSALRRAPAVAAPAPSAAVQAEALAGAATLTAPGARYDGAAARFQAGLRGLHVPLPAGGTFNGVRWEQGGPVTAAQMDGVLEYNAMCQWLRAWRDGRARTVAAFVLHAAPEWPALRGTETGRALARVAADVRHGGRRRLAGAVLARCDASHHREVSYARELGLAPSS